MAHGKNMKRFEEKDIEVLLVSDFGMTAELNVETKDKNLNSEVSYPLLKIYADETTEEMYMEFVTKNELIQVPLSKVKDLIRNAENEVHSEVWFNKNVFNR